MPLKITASLYIAVLCTLALPQKTAADLFYYPAEYRDRYDDSYALELELSRLKAGSAASSQRSAESLDKAGKDIENYKAQLAERNKKLESLETQAKELERRLKKEIADGSLRIKRQRDRLVINMDDKILFSSGSAAVKSGIFKTLKNIAEVLAKNRGNTVVIEGHTDDVPIQTPQFRDNWQLSSERAAAVLRALLSKSDLNPSRFSATGCAEYQPIVPNSNAANRQLNRRVDLIILPEI